MARISLQRLKNGGLWRPVEIAGVFVVGRAATDRRRLEQMVLREAVIQLGPKISLDHNLTPTSILHSFWARN